MPTYTFINTKTKKQMKPQIMSISEMEEFLAQNPDMDTVPVMPFIGDTLRQGMKKPEGGFRDVLKKIKRAHKGSEMNTW